MGGSMTELEQRKYKICLIGENAVGKTSLIQRFVHDEFSDHYLTTIGTKISKKDVVVTYPDQDKKYDITMMIWDIMGQKGFRPILSHSYFHMAKGGIAVCDLTRPHTLEELTGWIESMFEITGKIPVIVVANKNDLTDEIRIKEEDIATLAEQYDAPFLYTSAKTGANVEEAFLSIGRMVTEHQFQV